MNATIELLKKRGLFGQCTDEASLVKLMNSEKITFYVGIDPTFKSLHIGHVLPLIVAKHLCDAGHKVVILLGGGTARIGDPSGKTTSRKMLTYKEIDENAESIIKQIKGFLHIDGDKLQFANNKEWLENLNYIDFLRDIGSHFSVNKMLSFEAYKKRMETGLTFLEFNYQLLQSYDFLMLNKCYGVKVQLGGDDQWGNMVAGSDLIRRMKGDEVESFTIPLLTKSDGEKMGKTEGGALFLDAELCSPYQFFQYWRNVADSDVRKLLLCFTNIPIAELDELIRQDINKAKEILAYKITEFIHEKENADNALKTSHAAFGKTTSKDELPTCVVDIEGADEEVAVVDLFVASALAKTKSEARRLVEQGGAFLEDEQIKDVKATISKKRMLDEGVVLRAGKKRIMRLVAKT